ncbi:branched-chain amino acid transport system permease protein [Mesorhizobium soli]|uniref:branched-chain amino acid ABC transporter permease n=1 Tax=Pseudaminobacter soli (ex Li et al. 2025) TaxID=1295366 RepID=UPI002474D402|nr:branched-chain amino acid ABC transporter permease [Mesorhizobium soli]MDH6235028.1 branched-chain amino acid transport system permease protein [Mesorhizobium soli]
MIVLQNAIDAVSLGAVYALAALGIGLIFSVMRLINFAHGELIMAGGFCLYALVGQPLLVVILAVLIVSTVLALGMERVAFRPLRKANPATLLISSFAVSYLVQHVVLMIFGSRAMGVPFLPELGTSIEFLGLRIPRLQLVTVITTLVLMVGLVAFFRFSRIGLQMRAAAEDFTMARLVGVRANRVIAFAFAISGILASMVSFYLVAQTGSVSYKMGVNMVLIAFVSSVIGGMGSVAGAALGGFLVGIISVSLQAYLPVDLRPYRDAFVFMLFILFLFWRPDGLLMSRADRDRV